jgi:urease subunit gamma/beta
VGSATAAKTGSTPKLYATFGLRVKRPRRPYDGAVRLTDWEQERLLIFSAAELARRHRAAGLALNAPEAIAVICDAMLEAARAGSSYAEVEAAGRAAVEPAEVMPGVRELVDEVRLEVLLGDGARLIALVDPIGREGEPLGDDGPGAVIPAAVVPAGDLPANAGPERERLRLVVRNESARAVRVSSHYPFDRVNRRLVFDRAAAAGFRLDLPAGASLRWAPGETRDVELVAYGGEAAER